MKMENERKETLTFSTDADMTSLASLCGPLDAAEASFA